MDNSCPTSDWPIRLGFPVDNPILKGLVDVLNGGNVEQAMLLRDSQITSPIDFCRAAWEALAWLDWPHPISEGLIDQMVHCEQQLPADRRQLRWGEPLENGLEQAIKNTRRFA